LVCNSDSHTLRLPFLFFLASVLALNVCNAQSSEGTQEPDPFTLYSPPNAVTYKNLKSALSSKDKVYNLNLTNSDLEPKLWAKVGKLRDLQVLKLGFNHLSVLPEDFGNFSSLLYFSSKGNGFNAWPKTTGNWSSIMQIDLEDTRLDSLPAEIGNWSRLKTFEIQNNSDTLSLPSSFGFLNALTDVLIFQTTLRPLPSAFSNLDNLRSLTLVSCGLKTLPAGVAQLKNLTELILDNNGLERLPLGIYHLKNLNYLSIRNNKFSKLSEHICYLKNLSKLDVRGNSLDQSQIETIKALLPGCQVIWK